MGIFDSLSPDRMKIFQDGMREVKEKEEREVRKSKKDTTGTPVEKEEALDSKAAIARIEKNIKLVTLATQHIIEYDSIATASAIVGRAVQKCPVLAARPLLVNANKQLKAAIKAEKWLKVKSKKAYIGPATRNKNIERAKESLQEAIVQLETEVKRNSSTLVSFVHENFQADIPVQLPDSRKFKVIKIPMIVMLKNGWSLSKEVPHMKIEGKLFLLREAHVIGVNTDKVKHTRYDQASRAVTTKYGCSLYSVPLKRVSSNIEWFLFMDFDASIEFAGFVDSLEEGTISTEADTKIKTERLRTLRLEFEERNARYYAAIDKAKSQLDNIKAEVSALKEEFDGLTSYGDVEGLKPDKRNYEYLREHMSGYLHVLLDEGHSYWTARQKLFQQRIAARKTFYELNDYMEAAKKRRLFIKTWKAELEDHRHQMALEHGYVGKRELLELD